MSHAATQREPWHRSFRIDDAALKPHNNNLTLVRLVLASAVILTHCYWVRTDIEGRDWFSPLLGAPISQFAVDGFFFLSGMLVFRSLHRHGKVKAFILARLARMYPALAASVIGTILVGAAFTRASWPAYFGGEETLRFLFGNLSFLKAEYDLTGIRCGEQLCTLNGSLWTLPWEMRCYLLLAALSLLGLASRRAMAFLVLPATLAFAAVWLIPPARAAIEAFAPASAVYYLDQLARLWTLFALGCAASLWHSRLPMHGAILLGLAVAALLTAHTGWAFPFRILVVAYGVLYFGFRRLHWTPAIARWPDYSYGIYIYAFPVMMLLASAVPAATAGELAALNLAAVLPIAALSWHLLEKPTLDAYRRRFGTAAFPPEPQEQRGAAAREASLSAD